MGTTDGEIDRILGKRHHKDGDYWATPDGRLYVGSPFSTLSSLLMLHELGVPATHEAVAGGLDLIREAWRDDGRIRLAPKAPLYPCYTAEAARVMCRYGLAADERTRKTVAHFLDNAHESGGWRCSFSRFGKGPETVWANPGATLFVLDVLRFYDAHRRGGDEVDAAVDSLLRHWEVREPTGPCHDGIGTLFMQVEFPFLRYNLFFWVYALSFFEQARTDARFQEAFDTLAGKLDADGRMVVERPHRGLKGLQFCAKGEPSPVATKRYRESVENVAS